MDIKLIRHMRHVARIDSTPTVKHCIRVQGVGKGELSETCVLLSSDELVFWGLKGSALSITNII